MIDTDISVGAGLKATCSKDDLVAKLGVVARAVSTRTAVQVLAGVHISAADGQLLLAATDMELSLRSSLAAEVDAAGSTVVPGRLLRRHRRGCCPAAEVAHRAPRRGGRSCGSTCGSASYRLHTYSVDDFPRLPEVDAAQLLRGRPGRAARDRVAGAALRLSRRVAAGADRDPRPLRAGEARDGRDRLLPPRGQGDRARGLRARARGDHPGARARRAAAHRRARRRARARPPREPGRLRRRRRRG